jgi:hypothetical protein
MDRKMRFSNPKRLFWKGVILQIIVIVLLAFLLYKGCEYVGERGLKNVIEDVWEGSGEE